MFFILTLISMLSFIALLSTYSADIVWFNSFLSCSEAFKDCKVEMMIVWMVMLPVSVKIVLNGKFDFESRDLPFSRE